MNENVKTTCICEQGYDKGAFKKTIENNIFTIYGNIMKNNYIILRYHGELIDNINYENYTNNLYISYYFDEKSNEKTNVVLAKCSKCIGENYCVLIPLENHNNINFEFYITDNKLNAQKCNDLFDDEKRTFKLNISNNPLTDVLQKYGLEENPLLPIAQKDSEIQINKIINNIKRFFLTLFKKKDIA